MGMEPRNEAWDGAKATQQLIIAPENQSDPSLCVLGDAGRIEIINSD